MNELYFVIEVAQGPFNTIKEDCEIVGVYKRKSSAIACKTRKDNNCPRNMNGSKLFKYLIKLPLLVTSLSSYLLDSLIWSKHF